MRANRNVKIRLPMISRAIRKDVLDMCFEAHVGHIAPSLSIVDILTVLYFGVLRVDPHKPKNDLRDRFILSKGHAVSALYATLCERGFLSRKRLMTYCRDGGILSTHPLYDLAHGVEMTTGSLGHGLSVGSGMAYGLQKRYDKKSPRVYVLLSDSEFNTGSTWEAVMFAAHHHISNIVAVCDINGLQAFGRTKDIIDLEPIEEKWKAFGWQTERVSGHDHSALYTAFTKTQNATGPRVILADTIGGKGVSFMENTVDWHYWPLTPEQYKEAARQIEKGSK